MASVDTGAVVATMRVYRMSIWIRFFAAAFVVFTILGLFGLLWRQTPGLAGRNPWEWSGPRWWRSRWAGQLMYISRGSC
jgi:hypothetical protein